MNQGFLVIKLKSILRMFYVRHRDLGYSLWNIFATRICSVCRNPTRSFLHSWLQNKIRVTWRVPHVKQEQLTLPEYVSAHRFSVGFVFICVVLYRSLFVLLAIVLSVFRFTTSYFPFWKENMQCMVNVMIWTRHKQVVLHVCYKNPHSR